MGFMGVNQKDRESVDTVFNLIIQYTKNQTPENREAVLEAVERVPEHLKPYLNKRLAESSDEVLDFYKAKL